MSNVVSSEQVIRYSRDDDRRIEANKAALDAAAGTVGVGVGGVVCSK